MPSPFPGMNPYIEQRGVWHDFHQAMLVALREQLGRQVRPHFTVRLEERIYYRELPDDDWALLGRPDISVTGEDAGISSRTATATAMKAPSRARVRPVVDIIRIPQLEVRDSSNEEAITIIEVIVPMNKSCGVDRVVYLGKRQNIVHSPAHFVEIDLLRGGEHMPLQDMPDCDYCVMVSRYEERPEVGIWPLRLRDPLPIVPVPLRDPHPDATLDLMAALHHVYDAAGYADYIYRREPSPPLHPADQKWAELPPGIPDAT